MAVRQDKTITIGPRRIFGIVAQVAAPQYSSDLRQAHWRAGMTGFRILDGVHRQRAQSGCNRLIEPSRDLGRHHIHRSDSCKMARRRFSTSLRIIGVRISCMARSSLLPGITMEFARDMKLPWIMVTR